MSDAWDVDLWQATKNAAKNAVIDKAASITGNALFSGENTKNLSGGYGGGSGAGFSGGEWWY